MITEAMVKTYIEAAKAELKEQLLEELGELITSKYEDLDKKKADKINPPDGDNEKEDNDDFLESL